MTSILLAAFLGVGDASAHSGNHHMHQSRPVATHNRRHVRPAPVRHHRWIWVSGHWKVRSGNLIWISGHWKLRNTSNNHQHRHCR